MKKIITIFTYLFCSTFLSAQIGWVGNLFPSGMGNTAATGTGYNITIDTWKDGTTNMAGQGGGISCTLFYGEVSDLGVGAPWMNIMSLPMTYFGDTGNNDVYSINLDVSPGNYEYTCYCDDGNGQVWNSGNNGGVVFAAAAPIELVQFIAIPNKTDVKLEWQTSSEQNNSHFDIERSIDSRNWTKIGEVKGSGVATEALSYQYIDKTANLGINYYRFKQVDYNGEYEYSFVVTADLKGSGSVSVFPN